MIGLALVVGFGTGGMSAAIALWRIGVMVRLIDADPAWWVDGGGIGATGISLRAVEKLGVLDRARERCFIGAGKGEQRRRRGNNEPAAAIQPGAGRAGRRHHHAAGVA